MCCHHGVWGGGNQTPWLTCTRRGSQTTEGGLQTHLHHVLPCYSTVAFIPLSILACLPCKQQHETNAPPMLPSISHSMTQSCSFMTSQPNSSHYAYIKVFCVASLFQAARPAQQAYDPTKLAVSPITGELVPIQDMAEHMRVSLIDPRWKEQREAMLSKIRDTTRADDDEITRNLVGLAKTRPDIFGRTLVVKAVGRAVTCKQCLT